jgi:hypothetical protein
MAEAKSPFERGLATFKDALTAIRDGLLIALVLLLLIAPATINRRLTEAGFTAGSTAGLQWKGVVKQASTAAKNAGQQIADVEAKLTEYTTRLRAIETSAADPELKSSIKQLADEMRDSQEKARLADHAVKNSLLTQQRLIERVSPASIDAHGWIYVGTATDDKQRWTSSSTVDARPPNLQPGTLLKIRDDVYLRKDTGAPTHATAPVVAVLGVGSAVEVHHVEYARADGGWLVWAEVTRRGPSSR